MATSPAPKMIIQIAKIITVYSCAQVFPSSFTSTITLARTVENIAVSQDRLLPPKTIAGDAGFLIFSHALLRPERYGKHSRPIASTPKDHPVAVVLDLMNPLRPARRSLRDGRVAGLDKARRHNRRSTYRIPVHPHKQMAFRILISKQPLLNAKASQPCSTMA